MTVRPIRPEEREAFEKVQTIAFVSSHDFGAERAAPEPPSDGRTLWAAFGGGGGIEACMESIPYAMAFRGSVARMAGIGGVASLPEHRRGGHIRAIFKRLLTELREGGVPFSYLYPFSHAFYRKFGYEVCCAGLSARYNASDFARLPPRGRLEMYRAGDDLSPYRRIHESFSLRYNLAVVRDDARLSEDLGKDPYTTRQYSYLWRSDAGEALGYLTFTANRRESEQELIVRRLEWLRPEGLFGILSLLDRFQNPYTTMKWEAPPSVEPMALIAEPYDVELRRSPGGMLRVVDFEAALRLTRPPEGSGRAVVRVADGFLDWNDAAFALEWEGGGLRVSRTDRAPDLTAPAPAFAQILSGFVTPAIARETGTADIAGNMDALSRLFPSADCYCAERF